MTRKAILQIGTEKTGTTTLQHFLAANRDRLETRGWRYPRFCGETNHTGLAAYAMHPDRADGLRDAMGVRGAPAVEALRGRMRQAARAELADGANAIFCSEHCHSRLASAAEAETLRAFLAEFFDEVEVCVYLRRQDQVALSLYSTRLKSGDASDDILPMGRPTDPYYDYDRFLSFWEAAFGRERVHVRLFDRAELVGGSVVPDFLAAWDLGTPAAYEAVPDRNASVAPVAQDFLRRLNRAAQAQSDRRIEAARGPLNGRLETAFAGRGARPARAEAEAFFAQFQASNEAVRARHFPRRARLFDLDFSAYPETADARDFDADALAGVAATVHAMAQDEIHRLEAEVALRDARLAWQRDQRPAAIAALRRALGWRPRHPEANRTLGEYLLREDRAAEAVAPARTAAESRPTHAEYWHFLGIVLRRTGALEGALAAQDRALALEPAYDGAARERDQIRARLDEAQAQIQAQIQAQMQAQIHAQAQAQTQTGAARSA